jgi:hypothetical protein
LPLFFFLPLILCAGPLGHKAFAAPISQYLGAFPGTCQAGSCPQGEEPASLPPPSLSIARLSHELSSPACLTDRIYIHQEYPTETGSLALDALFESDAKKAFEDAKAKALRMSCNDFLGGCEGYCLPIAFETRLYFQQSSPSYLSVFRVDRFTGNIRKGKSMGSTVDYSFRNYDLATGRELAAAELFPDPKASLPQFWFHVSSVLERREGSCPLGRLRLNGRAPRGALRDRDYLLSSQGLTILLQGDGRPKGCQPQAVDVPKDALLGMGADPKVFGIGPARAGDGESTSGEGHAYGGGSQAGGGSIAY